VIDIQTLKAQNTSNFMGIIIAHHQ